jgi:hypothetical protein
VSNLADRVHAAISEHLADNGGGMVTEYHVIANVIDSDGEQQWIYAVPSEQLLVTTIGLIEWARGVAQYEQRCHLRESGYDED